jgi:hypothetical protein
MLNRQSGVVGTEDSRRRARWRKSQLADMRESVRAFPLLTFRDSQFADRAHEILFCGPPQLSTQKRARGIASPRIIFRSKLPVSVCSCLVVIRSGEGVIHRRKTP